jgi:ParB/RepB/Spo0J family partition protein
VTDPRISRSVPLDQLRQPDTDVREHRPQDAVKSLAASMGDPDVGQLQDVLAHPVLDDLETPPETADDLDRLFRDGHPVRIVDGETRRLAAERLGWATLDATIVPQPPDEPVIAQLDANTERIDMSGYETVRALYDHYQATEQTLAELADQTGFSPSYLSDVFSTMDTPEWLINPWRHPNHPLETSHARAAKSFLTENTVERYQDAGSLTEDEARDRAVEDARLMIDVQAEHNLQVGEFRKRCTRKKKETVDQLSDQRSIDEKRDDGQASRATTKASLGTPADQEPEPCMVCGQDAATKIALDVCRNDYGLLSDMKANNEPLMTQANPSETPQLDPPDDTTPTEKAAQGLAQTANIPPDQALKLIKQIQQDAAQPPHETTDD